MIIASALRRPTTLYWWLLLAESNPVIILSELEYCLTAADRDKSDAAGSVIELAAIYADDEHLEQLRSQLASSRYQHFRSAVQNWNGRSAQLARLRERISNTKFRENLLNGQPPPDDLEEYATELALRCKIENSIAARRQLGDTTRFIWSQLSIHARARNLNPY